MANIARKRKALAARIGSMVAAAGFVLFSATFAVAFTAMPAQAASVAAASPVSEAPALSASRALTTAVAPTPTPVLRAERENERRTVRGDQVITGEDYTLRSGETLVGDLNVFGGSVLLEEGSRVEGNVTVSGGDADVYGTITGDLTLLGGTSHLRESARVEGHLNVWGGQDRRDAGAYVGGNGTRVRVPNFNGNFPFERRGPGPFNWLFDLIGNVFTAVVSIVLMTLFAVAAVALFPLNVARVAETVQRQALVSGSIGVLTFVAVLIIAGLLVLTICMIPAAVILVIALGLAIMFGWAVSALIVGERLMRGFNYRDWTPVGQAALGALALGILVVVPIIGWLVSLTAAALGLGAVILTRAGTRPYPPVPVEPPASAPPALPPTTA